jgi:uncharacterized protein YdbL (DUF1318 family)
MNRFTRILSFAMLSLLLLSQGALAATLEEAKAAGQIGEKQDGYIGLVQSSVPADVAALVESVNAQRRARYEQIATSNGIPVAEVAKLAFERAFEATRSGHFVESAPGQWVRKP